MKVLKLTSAQKSAIVEQKSTVGNNLWSTCGRANDRHKQHLHCKSFCFLTARAKARAEARERGALHQKLSQLAPSCSSRGPRLGIWCSPHASPRAGAQTKTAGKVPPASDSLSFCICTAQIQRCADTAGGRHSSQSRHCDAVQGEAKENNFDPPVFIRSSKLKSSKKSCQKSASKKTKIPNGCGKNMHVLCGCRNLTVRMRRAQENALAMLAAVSDEKSEKKKKTIYCADLFSGCVYVFQLLADLCVCHYARLDF